jgi:hypothetical protein
MKSYFANSLVSKAHMYFIVVSRAMVSGSRKPLRAVLIILANLVKATSLISKWPPLQIYLCLHISGYKPPTRLSLVLSNPIFKGQGIH